jgi:hypothetical protein
MRNDTKATHENVSRTKGASLEKGMTRRMSLSLPFCVVILTITRYSHSISTPCIQIPPCPLEITSGINWGRIIEERTMNTIIMNQTTKDIAQVVEIIAQRHHELGG